MSDINIEKTQQKVADLAMAGQGCAIWDELKSLSRSDLAKVIEGVQGKSPNPDAQELRHLPAFVLKEDPFNNLPGMLIYTITAVDGTADKSRTEILYHLNDPFAVSHECLNLNRPEK